MQLTYLTSEAESLPKHTHRDLIALPQRQRTEIIRLPPAKAPDEKKVRELNELAASHPFCIVYKAKEYDTL
jgi:hypothetical protein